MSTHGHHLVSSILSFYSYLTSIVSKCHLSPHELFLSDCILSLYGVKFVDSEYLSHMGDSVVLQRGSSIADKCISTKKSNLYFIEQGINVMVGERKFCMEVAVDKINHQISRMVKGLVQVIGEWKEGVEPVTRHEAMDVEGANLLLDYVKSTFKQEVRNDKKKNVRVSRKNRTIGGGVSMTRNMVVPETVYK